MSATAQLPHREVTPPNFVQRIQQATPVFKQPDPKAQFLTNLANFQKNTGEFELEASEYLYNNSEADEHEYRVHCHLLGALIADGQALIIQANANKLTGLDAEKQFLEKKVELYIAMLHDWHGAPGSHSDEPEAFKQGMLQADFTKAKTTDL